MNPSCFFEFGDKVYFFATEDLENDEDEIRKMYEFDGTSISEVEGYVPLVAVATLPSGGGTDYEQINLLTPKMHQRFSANGTSTEFFIRDKGVQSIYKVLVNEEEKTLTTDYTVDTANGKVTFTNAPAEGVDNVDIFWAENYDTSTYELITNNNHAILYGGYNDTKVFLYGNPDNVATIYYSDIGDMKPRADYFPANNFVRIGTDNYSITGIAKHYDRLVISKEHELFYAGYTDMEANDTLGNAVTLPALQNFQLNDTIGNIKGANHKGKLPVLDNYPIVISNKGIYRIMQSNVRAESNVQYISQRVQDWIDSNINNINIVYDFEKRHEMWIVGKGGRVLDAQFQTQDVMVYNYELDVFYKFIFPDKIKDIVEWQGELYITTDNGIMVFNEDLETFGNNVDSENNEFYGYYDWETGFKIDTTNLLGVKIPSRWEMGFYNFGYEYKRKMLTRLWVSCMPYQNSNIDIDIETDRGHGNQTFYVDIVMSNFTDVNFGRYSFDTVYNPKPKRLKAKAKKFVYFRLILSNDEWKSKYKILQLTLQWQLSGDAK